MAYYSFSIANWVVKPKRLNHRKKKFLQIFFADLLLNSKLSSKSAKKFCKNFFFGDLIFLVLLLNLLWEMSSKPAENGGKSNEGLDRLQLDRFDWIVPFYELWHFPANFAVPENGPKWHNLSAGSCANRTNRSLSSIIHQSVRLFCVGLEKCLPLVIKRAEFEQ